ncbi:hypothetical protein K443DRAFT_537450 [Laccaria amethystina LaAM-08-1]|uniref:Unplaced genomic scaffold K443scaffold_605, whole genome shotgun sequence n=1 Tax=Laccaria amethystina LaAM-08-1 TaxID=1095629 RepID=A0A0C9X267_9AGAR|nr:hypothetical protein K443DRAFT_537450 [Laccaria amethystina LaAM-08-1]
MHMDDGVDRILASSFHPPILLSKLNPSRTAAFARKLKDLCQGIARTMTTQTTTSWSRITTRRIQIPYLDIWDDLSRQPFYLLLYLTGVTRFYRQGCRCTATA